MLRLFRKKKPEAEPACATTMNYMPSETVLIGGSQ